MRSIIFNSAAALLLNFTQLIGAEVREVVVDLADGKAGDLYDRKASKPSAANYANLQTKSQLKRRVRKIKSQEGMDQFVSEQAVYYYDLINTSGRFRYQTHDKLLSVNSALWERTTIQVTARNRDEYFTIKSGTTSAEAVTDLFETGGAVDCTFIMHLVQIKIALDLWGPEYSGGRTLPMLSAYVIGYKCYGGGIPMEPGASGAICNIDIYSSLHPYGSVPNENVFCVGKNDKGQPLYVGFGKIFAGGPITLEVIYDHLYEQTIVEPILGNPNDSHFERHTKYIAECIPRLRKSRSEWDKLMERTIKEQGRSAVLKIKWK